MNQQVQDKNSQIQKAIQDQIEFLILLEEFLGLITLIVPGFIWVGWGTMKRVDQTTDEDLAGLSPTQASEWAQACTDEVG